jgi:two-component system, OmpR family, KDP operon response regulator KdpE
VNKSVFKKAVIIDDEKSICRFVRLSLEAHGYEVFESQDGVTGIQEVIARRPTIVLLDMALPDMSGQQVLEKIREWSQVPIIILTVRDSEEEKVKALDAGANDYVTKPFGVQELLARMRVAERHSEKKADSPVFQIGPLEIDRSSRTVKVDGKEVKLRPTEYDLLNILCEHAGKVITHRKLLQSVWGPNHTEHTQYLRVYIGHLRKRLQISPETPNFIQTEAGVGYRLALKKHTPIY